MVLVVISLLGASTIFKLNTIFSECLNFSEEIYILIHKVDFCHVLTVAHLVTGLPPQGLLHRDPDAFAQHCSRLLENAV